MPIFPEEVEGGVGVRFFGGGEGDANASVHEAGHYGSSGDECIEDMKGEGGGWFLPVLHGKAVIVCRWGYNRSF